MISINLGIKQNRILYLFSDFLQLFYDVLFLPSKASLKIKALSTKAPAILTIYTMGVVVLSSLAMHSHNISSNTIFTSILFWLINWGMVAFLVWLIRPKSSKPSLRVLLFFTGLAQAPLILSPLAEFWYAPPVTEIKTFTFVINFWAFGLNAWAISQSLEINIWKSLALVLLPIIHLILLIVGLLGSLIYLLLSMQ